MNKNSILKFIGLVIAWTFLWLVLDTVGNFSLVSTWQGWAVVGLVGIISILLKK